MKMVRVRVRMRVRVMEQLAKRKGSGRVGSDRIKFALDETAPEELFFAVMSANTKVALSLSPLTSLPHSSFVRV